MNYGALDGIIKNGITTQGGFALRIGCVEVRQQETVADPRRQPAVIGIV